LAAVNRGRIRDSHHHGLSVVGVADAGVLHRPVADPVCRLQVALLPFTGRTGPVWDGGLPSLILPAATWARC
jgi:hypothetical protein